MQIPTQRTSSPPRILGILVSMNHTLKKTHMEVTHMVLSLWHLTLLSPSSVIATVCKRQVGEEHVTHVVEQERCTHVRLNCYFIQRIKPWNLQIQPRNQPPSVFWRDSELQHINCKIIGLFLYSLLKISLFKKFCCEGLSTRCLYILDEGGKAGKRTRRAARQLKDMKGAFP